jgi:outer membrane protein TolC
MTAPLRFALISFAFITSYGFSQPTLVAEKVFPELQPILATALQQSPRMLERNLDLEASAGDLLQAKAGLYPGVSAYFQDSRTRDRREDIVGTQKTEKLYYSLSVSQPIYHWGAIRNRAKMGEIRDKLASQQYGQAYAVLAQEIRGTYLRLIVLKVQLQTARYDQQQTEQALRLAEDRLKNRVISDAEIFHPRIAVQQAVLNTDRAEEAFSETKKVFRLLTGVSAPADDAIPVAIGAVKPAPQETDRLLAAFLGHPEPKTFATNFAKGQLEIERLGYAINRTGLRPKFSAVAGISQDEQSYSTNIAQKYGVQSLYLGISGSWNIFDGFATRGAVRSSLARVRKLEANYKQLTETAGADAQRAAHQLKFVERQMAIQDQLMDSATNFLQYRKDEFARGTVSETDVAAVQGVYNREFLTTLQSRSEYLLKFSEFLSLIMEDPAMANVPARFR